ncbi:hypothetical protein RD792_007468 [Penstemon davidsonii]|uniref:Uncharacterized protein n=1 Tax=Penstemon davidsonii TaxID=160366 RepID=A0ABR0D8B8_9LAMI|nr:hypothetical protein RD792_007468 [Penstemon davidsonii]
MEKNSITAAEVCGSTKFDLYDVDFGWVKETAMDVVSIDGEKYSLSPCKSRHSKGGYEINLSLPKEKMKFFEAIYYDGLQFLTYGVSTT